jgi:thymidylate kinase
MNQRKLLIVEGPDGCGKTTLIEALRRRLQSKVIHHGAYIGEKEIAHHFMKSMWPAFTGKQNIILDRCWLSDRPYAAYYRKEMSRVHWVDKQRMLERVALSCEACVILCLPPISVARENFTKQLKKGGEYLSGHQRLKDHEKNLEAVATWEKIYHDYDTVVPAITDLPVVRYDYTMQEPWEMMRAVEFWREAPNLGPGAGAFRPGVTLLVGEQLSPRMKAGFPPFVSFDDAGCSRFLASVLSGTHVRETGLYFVNAKSRGKFINPGFLAALRPGKIVALGEVAAEWCRETGHVYETVPHPQYWHRFHSTKPYPLINLLKGKVDGYDTTR